MKNKEHVIVNVIEDSIAGELMISPGDVLLSVNGENIEDVFDYRFMIRDGNIELLIRKKDGEEIIYDIDKDPDEDLGLEFDEGLMDGYRSCCNKCVFCFIDQMPPGMRDTLYFKDDDMRLSFLQGNYVTLTNMSEHDLDRIIRYRLEPINISFHTTNPELRVSMLKNRFAGEALKKAGRLYEAGIRMNGQIVLCKGMNDGKELERTIGDLYSYAPTLCSLSVVPVGLTRYRQGLCELEPFSWDDALDVIDIIHRWQEKSYREKGIHFVHASDEWYILAGLDLPLAGNYDGYPQIENGVGMLRSFMDEFDEAMTEIEGISEEHSSKRGPAKAVYKLSKKDLLPDKRLSKTVSVATGRLAYPYIQEMAERLTRVFKNINVIVYGIYNEFFGEAITVSGLITGQDLIKQLKNLPLGDELILPCTMLRAGEDVFLDDVSLNDLERELNVRVRVTDTTGYDFIRALTH